MRIMKKKSDLRFKLVKPDKSIQNFVYCFSSLQNFSDFHDGVIIPNGRVDLIFSRTNKGKIRVTLMGLETKPKHVPKQPVTNFFSVSFNPVAIEYLLNESVADIVDSGKLLTEGFWGFTTSDLTDFNKFCKKITKKIKSLIPDDVDERKLKLFDLIFSTNGEISVQELSDKVIWSPRQIGRYFNQQFGMSVKSYCSILRFQASLPHIKAGKLAPQLNFTDQSHFIKEVKKLSGVSPKELSKNKNDRFLQFLAVDPE
jgi:AraC-like DNA-binding protein